MKEVLLDRQLGEIKQIDRIAEDIRSRKLQLIKYIVYSLNNSNIKRRVESLIEVESCEFKISEDHEDPFWIGIILNVKTRRSKEIKNASNRFRYENAVCDRILEIFEKVLHPELLRLIIIDTYW